MGIPETEIISILDLLKKMTYLLKKGENKGKDRPTRYKDHVLVTFLSWRHNA